MTQLLLDCSSVNLIILNIERIDSQKIIFIDEKNELEREDKKRSVSTVNVYQIRFDFRFHFF